MSSPTPGPMLHINTLDDGRPRSARFLTGPVSIAVHLAVVAALVLVPLLTSGELPPPASGVRAFLVEPTVMAAPPPPPPAAAAASSVRRTPAPATAQFVAPVAVPDAIVPEEAADLGVAGGVAGGVEGGVEGGVVGGIVGGLPAAAPPPVTAVRVGGRIHEPKKLKHVAPDYPTIARQSRITGIVILEALISADGHVETVSVLRSIPVLDEAAVNAVKQWVYSPTLLDGVPVPVIMTVTLTFSLHQ